MESSCALEGVRCSICNGIYRSPHMLQCNHTFCKSCIDGLPQSRRRVECPSCTQTSHIRHISEDLKAQAPVHVHSSNQSISTSKRCHDQQKESSLTSHNVTSKETTYEVLNSRMEQCDYTDLPHYRFNQVKKQDTVRPVERMVMINNKLYCASGSAGICVYNTDCKLIKQYTCASIQQGSYVTSLADYTDHDLIVTTAGQGIHHLTLNGEYMSCVSKEGWFSDVCTRNSKVYALDYGCYKIQIFEVVGIDKKWQYIKDIKLNYTNSNSFDKMVMTAEHIYVSLNGLHCVHIYHAAPGVYQRCIYFDENRHIKEPMISNVDAKGRMLLCDRNFGNGRLGILDGGNWYQLLLPDINMPPADVVVARHEGRRLTLWVAVHGNSGQIFKYDKIIKKGL